eukprot:TRINITY_DN6398_c2_g2_i1.p1 TRINITY_DN6398_c2_g2~~TRINITY_DN6398_c2_g2_i1.p1  ORF type:complete len:384 (+),score=174.04 TRINITY_DN6398_c2_g2_i1:100-1251(+)
MKTFTKLKALDAYPKTLDDYRVRTLSGALVSIIAGFAIMILIISELNLYLNVEVQPHLSVDTSIAEKLKINFDFEFPKIPCLAISVDAMDVSGSVQFDIDQRIKKQRISQTGTVISEQEEVKSKKGTENKVATACGSCYGAEEQPNQCCNTCDEVREAYRKKGWTITNFNTISQCIDEGWQEKFENQKNEGCRISGFLLVNKVAGNFHFAPGKSFQQQHAHVHDLNLFGLTKYNFSHHIHSLSFGEYVPGIINPLDNANKVWVVDNPIEGVAGSMFHYYVKVVPTTYTDFSGNVIKTNQYSATEQTKTLVMGRPESHGLPGVFVSYDLSPIMVELSPKTKSFAHFLTGVCAIVGGIFTVAGMIDAFLYHGVQTVKKMRIGKAN